MNFVARLSNPPSEQVLREAEGVIQAWGLSSGFPKDVVCRLVSCFDSKFLLSLPRPPGFKRKKFSAEQIPAICGIGKPPKLSVGVIDRNSHHI